MHNTNVIVANLLLAHMVMADDMAAVKRDMAAIKRDVAEIKVAVAAIESTTEKILAALAH